MTVMEVGLKYRFDGLIKRPNLPQNHHPYSKSKFFLMVEKKHKKEAFGVEIYKRLCRS
jgi:hypothetical protein